MKKKALPKPPVRNVSKLRPQTDMRLYWSQTNWAELWDKWYLELTPAGSWKWRSTWHFAQQHAVMPEQRKFMAWYIGPKIENDPLADEYSFITSGPLDWMEKRTSGGWYNDKHLRALSNGVRQRMNALEALRESGNAFTLNMVARIDRLAQKLDEAFNGEFFLEGADAAHNFTRAREYIALHAKLLDMLCTAQDMYAKAHGINFQDMSGFGALLAASAISTQGAAESPQANRISRAMERIASMTLTKAAKYDLPLPAEVTDHVLEASAVAVPINGKKKNYQ